MSLARSGFAAARPPRNALFLSLSLSVLFVKFSSLAIHKTMHKAESNASTLALFKQHALK